MKTLFQDIDSCLSGKKSMEPESSQRSNNILTSRNGIILIGIVLLTAIIIVSLVRDRIVNNPNDVTTVIGRGTVSYQPDTAVVTLGVQVDKAAKAEDALSSLNNSMNNIITSVRSLGIPPEDIQTQSYSLFPHYEYPQPDVSNMPVPSTPSGYDANQQVSVNVKGIDKNPNLPGQVIEAASKAGANQVVGVSFDVSNLEELKQKARTAAIQDARGKSNGLAKAAGVRKLGHVVSWYENIIKSPDIQNPYYGLGAGGADKSAQPSSPQISGGADEIIIEIGLNYRIR